MYQDAYYVDKSSGTFADSLMAFGAADVLRRLLPTDSHKTVTIEDAGSHYVLVCEAPIVREALTMIEPFTCAPFILTPKNKSKLPPSVMNFSGNDELLIDYDAQKQRRMEFFEQQKALSKEQRSALAQRKVTSLELGLQTPHPDWDVFRAINPGALPAYNALMTEWWRGKEVAFGAMLEILLYLLASTPNDVDGAEQRWMALCKANGISKPADATYAQIFNPSQGKGQNRAKADKPEMNNIKGFWMTEYLKAVGLYRGAITRIVANPSDPRNAKDRKTYVIAPHKLDWEQHNSVLSEFKHAMTVSQTPIKMDILAVLNYTQAFLNHWQGIDRLDLEAELSGKTVNDFVSGMQTAFYKNLGNSAAVMNIATLHLPSWVAIGDAELLQSMSDVLDEHIRIVRGMDETRGDQCDMLGSYRAFLSGADWSDFFRFTTAYGAFLIRQRERAKPIKQLTTKNLEVLMSNSGNKDFTEILASEGFKRIAAAIRASTVTSQYYKSQDIKPRYEVRYGLGQELSRQAGYPDSFLSTLADFLRDYGRETAQMRERHADALKARSIPSLNRVAVRTSDIDEIVALTQRFGSRVVCNLLVAYGYATVKRDDSKDDGSGPLNQDDETNGEADSDAVDTD
jgi:hypothetical protein